MATDQRVHVRYTPPCDVFVSLGAGLTRIGSIRDINLFGAAFEHFPYNQPILPPDYCVDIFICHSDMHIKNIPCRIVYELPLSENPSGLLPDKAIIQKRCGLEFKAINSHHREQLELFLRQYMNLPASIQN